ncbi:hypothetical protein [Streptacidiphilus sp. P02-A3a]|uniref:hypothetical protein n=1 Tax=Streptacidiphilus sp. P02-A3a TaxID=2704468 RepID=UPI0015FCD1E1|nr:hypothetical protein [Streptacidiphilus sp. P02-A3a]QMU72278.1 hypothetical protein GXP74_32575 [Streptacidiphilus sp. P02-A3a]
MTHSGFRTEPDQLDALADALLQAGNSLQGALDALRDTTAASLGTDRLDRACEEFQQDWHDRLRQLRQQADDAAEGVRGSARSYRGTEHGLLATLAAASVPPPVPLPIPLPVQLSGGDR